MPPEGGAGAFHVFRAPWTLNHPPRNCHGVPAHARTACNSSAPRWYKGACPVPPNPQTTSDPGCGRTNGWPHRDSQQTPDSCSHLPRPLHQIASIFANTTTRRKKSRIVPLGWHTGVSPAADTFYLCGQRCPNRHFERTPVAALMPWSPRRVVVA